MTSGCWRGCIRRERCRLCRIGGMKGMDGIRPLWRFVGSMGLCISTCTFFVPPHTTPSNRSLISLTDRFGH
jgi:hypothetical protein